MSAIWPRDRWQEMSHALGVIENWLYTDVYPVAGAYSPPSPLALHYSDAVSSIFPDRPIRPLPKRRIRSRLSSETADSILNSSPSAPTEKLFQVPYLGLYKHGTGSGSQRSSLEAQASQSLDGESNNSYHFTGKDDEGDEEQVEGIIQSHNDQHQRPASLSTPSRLGHAISRNERSETTRYNRQPMCQSMVSSGDSVDGYDSFENTNNKKKRKIPTNGNHHSSLSAEMASMGISSTRDLDVSHADQDGGISHYYGSGSSAVPAKINTGLSAGAKSRFYRSSARRRSARSPLGVSFNGSNSLRRADEGNSEGLSKGNQVDPNV